MTKQLGALIATFALALTASACAADPGTTKTPTPVASDTQSADLAAAIDAFTVFNAAFDGYSSGSTSLDSLKPLVTDEYFATLAEQDATYSEQRVSGTTSFDSVVLVEDPPLKDWPDATVITLCRDLSRTEVVNQDGEPLDVPDRVLRVALIVYFTPNSSDSETLLITEMNQWPSPTYCS
ncbi:hypothetical protein [Labedella gwakjiensis]|uniref:Lipoprotein n=1 Tax=Labedella gwakjiensis TaxID=390269 RepID=A0ABY0C793_9MICO|nr:hypothetical protein [Labedella gwakjiensis]RUQ85925.1 hypothetical protein ELQ93_02585 [Labedella gwakjiensis]